MNVEVISLYSDELRDALNHLIPQLSSSAELLTRESLQEIVDAECSTLLIVRHEGCIVGSLTLVVFPIPTGTRAWIEDVVVDEAARGLGAGEALVHQAIDIARTAGARSVDLTSRASREAAHRLYEKVGFVIRETNVYRFSLE